MVDGVIIFRARKLRLERKGCWENWGIIAKLDLEVVNPGDRGIVGITVRWEGELKF